MRWNLGYKRLKMSNDRLENILIRINGPVLRKIHKDFDNILVSQAIYLYFQKKYWQWNLHSTSEENLGKNEESLFGPPIKEWCKKYLAVVTVHLNQTRLSLTLIKAWYIITHFEPMFPFSLSYARFSWGLQDVKNMNIGSNWVKHLNCHFFMLGLLQAKLRTPFWPVKNPVQAVFLLFS